MRAKCAMANHTLTVANLTAPKQIAEVVKSRNVEVRGDLAEMLTDWHGVSPTAARIAADADGTHVVRHTTSRHWQVVSSDEA